MAALSMAEWKRYKDMLAKISQKAADEFRDAVFSASGRFGGVGLNAIPRDELIDYAYGLATKYGEAAAAWACEMYDASAALEGAAVPPAIPAETATISEVAKAVNGTMKTGNGDIVADAVGRLVKTAGVDTTMKNAIRDGAEWAWIPSGDTCAFCITLASRGWQRASQKALKNGHAEHIHANCDCTYATRQTDDFIVRGYDPERYEKMYYGADGNTPKEKINAMRREFYQMNKDEINEQKRSAYAKRIAINSSRAEELNVARNKAGIPIMFDDKIANNAKFDETRELIKNLTNDYNTRLERIGVGAEKAAGDVDISGSGMRLNTNNKTTALHEFAHTLAGTRADKFGLTNDKQFWSDIRKVYRNYHKDVDADQDTSRWISVYEHSSRNLDEFMAEAFAHAKAKELGIDIPEKYGKDFKYSKQVLGIIDKYFKR